MAILILILAVWLREIRVNLQQDSKEKKLDGGKG